MASRQALNLACLLDMSTTQETLYSFSKVEHMNVQTLSSSMISKVVIFFAITAIAFTLVWCGEQTTVDDTDTTGITQSGVVATGDQISILYEGRTDDGELFDTNVVEVAQAEGSYNEQRPYEPLTFVVGSWSMIPGMEQWVIGMELNETKELVIEAADAYGERSDQFIQDIPLDQFAEAEIEPVEWEVYNFVFGPGTVLEVGEESVSMDFNHPLAGERLTFDVTVTEISQPTQAPVATE